MTTPAPQAQPAPARKRPPYFHTEVSIDYHEVSIRPEELEEAGWVYVGQPGQPEPDRETVLDVVRRWHEDTHDGPWQWCTEMPCDELRR